MSGGPGKGMCIRAIDLFCGAGGSSWGAQAVGVEIVAAFDCWSLAGRNHTANFPRSRFFEGRLEKTDVNSVARKLGPVDLILASPECTNHSPAKGGKPRCEVSKNMERRRPPSHIRHGHSRPSPRLGPSHGFRKVGVGGRGR